MKQIQQHPIIILDFGSQYTQLIARRVREMGVYCEIHPFGIDETIITKLSPSGLILSGGPASTTLETTPRAPDWIFQANLPILGICYGMQTMALQLGGEVSSSPVREFGYTALAVQGKSLLLQGITDKDSLDVWMSHGDKVTQLPPDFEIICSSQHVAIAGMANEKMRLYGLQFHPEVTHTAKGTEILERFVLNICKAPRQWTTSHIISQAIADLKAQVGSEKVLLALSGGVDSSVVAALLHRAIGEQLICVFVNTGLLRHKEVEAVQTMFNEHFGINLITVHAEDKFLNALRGISCPEEKRKRIGHTFIDVFDEAVSQLADVSWLAQGTIYPDVIESAATNNQGVSEVIKSHHNVGGLPENLKFKLLEPLRCLFKDEVRHMGLELGLPPEMIYRHPFPGPGLGVRILGEIKAEYINLLRQADAIFIEELYKAQLYDQVSQAFAVFLPVKSVGVMGDGRHYDYVICLRAVKTIDFMTAEWAHLPWDFLGQVSNRIINEVKGISRVTYDISGKPPATIEWE